MAENVSARRHSEVLWLPAGPAFRLEREIKNVVTVMAKTCHYWSFHTSDAEKSAAAKMIDDQLIEPAIPEEIQADPTQYQALVDDLCCRVREATGLSAVASPNAGWIGVPCGDVAMAVWLMRAIIVQDVLARREEDVLYLPVNSRNNVPLELLEAVTRAWRLWNVYG